MLHTEECVKSSLTREGKRLNRARLNVSLDNITGLYPAGSNFNKTDFSVCAREQRARKRATDAAILIHFAAIQLREICLILIIRRSSRL